MFIQRQNFWFYNQSFIYFQNNRIKQGIESWNTLEKNVSNILKNKEDVKLQMENIKNVIKQEVYQNLLEQIPEFRLSLAEMILGRELLPIEEQAIINAHNIGGEIDNLTKGQKFRKGYKLMRGKNYKETILTREDAEKLMDAGIVGDAEEIENVKKELSATWDIFIQQHPELVEKAEKLGKNRNDFEKNIKTIFEHIEHLLEVYNIKVTSTQKIDFQSYSTLLININHVRKILENNSDLANNIKFMQKAIESLENATEYSTYFSDVIKQLEEKSVYTDEIESDLKNIGINVEIEREKISEKLGLKRGDSFMLGTFKCVVLEIFSDGRVKVYEKSKTLSRERVVILTNNQLRSIEGGIKQNEKIPEEIIAIVSKIEKNYELIDKLAPCDKIISALIINTVKKLDNDIVTLGGEIPIFSSTRVTKDQLKNSAYGLEIIDRETVEICDELKTMQDIYAKLLTKIDDDDINYRNTIYNKIKEKYPQVKENLYTSVTEDLKDVPTLLADAIIAESNAFQQLQEKK